MQERLLAAVSTLGDAVYKDRPSFEETVERAFKANGISVPLR